MTTNKEVNVISIESRTERTEEETAKLCIKAMQKGGSVLIKKETEVTDLTPEQIDTVLINQEQRLQAVAARHQAIESKLFSL